MAKESNMKIETVTIVGAGYMGGSIAQVIAMAGMPVRIADVSVDAANDALIRLKNEAKEFEKQGLDRKSTRLNSSHVAISYAVFCLKKKINIMFNDIRKIM